MQRVRVGSIIEHIPENVKGVVETYWITRQTPEDEDFIGMRVRWLDLPSEPLLLMVRASKFDVNLRVLEY